MVSWYDRIDVTADDPEDEVESDMKSSAGSTDGEDDKDSGANSTDVQDTVAYVPRTVYAVLNQAHLSIFKSARDAKACARPEHVIDVRAMHSAGRGGEPVLITQQNAEMQDGQSPSFCVHLQIANPDGPVPLAQIFCMPDRSARSDFIAFLNNVIDGLRGDKRLADTAVADIGGSSMAHDPNMFPQPPRTICVRAKAGQLCLTSVALDVPDEQTGVDDSAVKSCCKALTAACLACAQGVSTFSYCKEHTTEVGCDAAALSEMKEEEAVTQKAPDAGHLDRSEMRDAIELRPARWASSFPVRASKVQTWSVSGVSDSGTVSICDGSDVHNLEDQSGGTMCISVQKSISMPGNIDLPVKKFTTCPGEDLRCFEVESVVANENPSAHDTDECSKACKIDKACQGWVQTRPQAERDRKAKCCLKKEDVSGQCKADRCCDAHMKSMTKLGILQVDPAVPDANQALFGVVQLAEKEGKDGSDHQQWRVLPYLGSTTEAKLQLAKGELCLALERGQTTKLVLGKCEDNEDVLVFAFAGFSERGEQSRDLYEIKRK
jgi:hypothetical protein